MAQGVHGCCVMGFRSKVVALPLRTFLAEAQWKIDVRGMHDFNGFHERANSLGLFISWGLYRVATRGCCLA